MAPGARGSLKRESGLPTPGLSSHSPTPVKQEIDLTSDSEDQHISIYSVHHGLPMEDFKQQRRSPSTPSPSSLPSRPSRRQSAHPSQPQPSKMTPLNPDGLAIVGRDAKRLIDTIEKLKQIGLQSIDTELPELVLVGDQSAGKSSLMGAIAEINLPKGQSMCTRCPTNIKTSQADTWRCVVSLQLSYIRQKTPPNAEFPGWVESARPMETKPFMTLTHKAQLEHALQMAQFALLNPSQDVRSFIPDTDEYQQRYNTGPHADEAKFSPNVISVEICGPGLPNLSFYDLPGLFQAAEDTTQEYLIRVFENLTRKYIRHPNTLIICTITMQNDPGLSRTKAVIGHSKAEHRCIGVLTMPDRLQTSATAHSDYDNIFKKKKFVLPLGYFVTKQPGANAILDPEKYHEVARRQEIEFFDSDPLWREGGQWHPYRDICGTSAIQKYLSRQFASLILNSIPDLTQKIHDQTREVDEQLALLPEVPNDKVQHIVRRELHEFSNRVQRLVTSSSSSAYSFHSEWKKLCHQFLKATEVMRPGCNCRAVSDNDTGVIVLDEESDDNMSVVSSPLDKKRGHDSEQNGEKRLKTNNARSRAPMNAREPSIPLLASQQVKQERTPRKMINATPKRSANFRKFKKEEFGPFYEGYLDAGAGALSIMDIRASIEAHAVTGIPGYVNHQVRVDYALAAVSAWEGPLKTFIDYTFQTLRTSVLSILDTVLQKYIHTELYRRSKRQIEKFLEDQEREQRQVTLQFFETERLSLFTINDDSFNQYQQEALEALTAQRRKIRLDSFVARQLNNGAKINDEEKFKASVTDQQLGPDKYIKELKVAAYIRGYYTTARIRFTDTICANMNARYFQIIKRGVVDYLENALGLNEGDSEQICRDLLEGNAEISTRRNALKLKKAQLHESNRVLDQLKVEFNSNNGHDSDEDMEGNSFAATPFNQTNGYLRSNGVNGRGHPDSRTPTINGSPSQTSSRLLNGI